MTNHESHQDHQSVDLVKLGDFEILEQLGKGFWGKVYKACDTRESRTCAVKLIRKDLSGTPGFADRFNTILNQLKKLNHANISSIGKIGQSNNQFYYSMDLAPGDGNGSVTLEDLIKKNNGILDVTLLIQLLGGVLSALAQLHESGIVHGNMKPSNIVIYRLPDGRLVSKIVDVGSFEIIGSSEFRARMRKAVKESMKQGIPQDARGDAYRALLNTREYMAPEMIASGKATPAGDVYSMGLIFYRLMTGVKLSPRPPSHYNQSLSAQHDKFILRALEPDSEDRYKSAAEMLDALEPVRDLINRQVQQQRLLEQSEKINLIRERASELISEERLEEAKSLLWDLMEQYPGRQDVLDDYSAVETRLIELRRIADREEQYHWDTSEARELEASGKMTEALKVWVLLSRLYSDKPEVMDEVTRLSAITGQKIDGDTLEEEVNNDELELRQRISSYRRRRNAAWDLADEEKFDEALELIEDIRLSVSDRPELVAELEMIQEETMEARDTIESALRKKRIMITLMISAGVCLTAIAVGIVWFSLS